MFKHLVVLLLAFGCSSQADAAQCENPTVFGCAFDEWMSMDKVMNETYRALLREDTDAVYQALVKKGQRNWVQVRNAQCEAEVYFIRVVDAPNWLDSQYKCLARMTEQRTQELERLHDQR